MNLRDRELHWYISNWWAGKYLEKGANLKLNLSMWWTRKAGSPGFKEAFCNQHDLADKSEVGDTHCTGSEKHLQQGLELKLSSPSDFLAVLLCQRSPDSWWWSSPQSGSLGSPDRKFRWALCYPHLSHEVKCWGFLFDPILDALDLDSYDGEHFHGDSVELVEAAPRSWKTSPQVKRHKPSLLFTSLTILTFITR